MRDMVILAWVFAIVGAIFGITVTVIGERQDREVKRRGRS